ncbi:MAG: zinc-binding dehydrogenase [Pseudomonadota bacterium]
MSDGHECLEIFRHDDDPVRAVRKVLVTNVEPAADEVVVENHYAGVNAVYDAGLIRGSVERADATLPTPFGFESVGRVVAVGSAVDRLAIGQAVASVGFGRAYREQFVAPAADLTPIAAPTPEALTLVPTGISAYLALHVTGEIRASDQVLVTAAAGGFGHIAVQVALAAAARVVAVTGSVEKAERLRDLGVDSVINYRTDTLPDALEHEFPRGIDLALDTVGATTFDAIVARLAPHGRLVSAGFTADSKERAPVLAPRVYTQLYWKAASIRAFMNPLFKDRHPEARDALFARLAAGDLKVWTHRPYFDGLDAVPDAIACLLSGANTGKVVVRLPAASATPS